MVYNRTQTNMKKIMILAFALSLAILSMAQNSGRGFNYQAVVRNADGMLLANSNVTLRVSLYPGQMASTPTWVEQHSVQTDMSGCFGLTVGHGQRESTSIAANFSDVNFEAVYYWMKIEVNEGGNYREVSFAGLPSSPYSESAFNANPIPAGFVIPFAGTAENIPAGWMLCDGRSVSRSDFANLYNAIGVAWGTGNGSTTFNIPDMRGMFLRGVAGFDTTGDPDANLRLANANGGNPGNHEGSYQGDGIRNITGSFKSFDRGYSGVSGVFSVINRWSAGVYHGASDDWGSITDIDASRVVPVGSDNRPKNVAVNYIIKY